MNTIEQSDLKHILDHVAPFLDELRGTQLFLTGGTGFFGTWLLGSLTYANRQLGLGIRVTVLTRKPEEFVLKAPSLAADPAVTLLPGDVRDFKFPTGEFRYVIHAATEASVWLAANRPKEMLSTIIEGTEKVLEFAGQAGTRKLLMTSSGAVYGNQPPELSHTGEEYEGCPDTLQPGNVYGVGKRYAELLCSLAANETLEIKIARCFAFVGPHLPIDSRYAIGNFISDVLSGRPISVGGDGTSVRSYLYASDLIVWLWTILIQGRSMRAYNVGSEDSVTILDLAQKAASLTVPPSDVKVAMKPVSGRPAARYVPSTGRARQELKLDQTVSLEEGLRRTLAWHRMRATGRLA